MPLGEQSGIDMRNFPPQDPFGELDDLELCNLGMGCIEDSDDWKAQAAWKHFKVLRDRLQACRVVDRIHPTLVFTAR